jgi:DNA-binding SARP family transcriptional activator
VNVLQISLFGKFSVKCQQILRSFETKKPCELFCYLLLYRERPHHREFLASLLWPDRTKSQSLKYLRHALWQLQNALDESGEENAKLLQVEAEWVSLNPDVSFWLDVEALENAYELVKDRRGRDLDAREAQVIQQALELYQGDLLQGWYQEWCILERGRLQRTYLALLEKQMAYCEAQGKYKVGLGYGYCALRHDEAHERVHRRLMRLHYQAGNRTAALRQYNQCVASLRRELNVAPSQRTMALYEQIRLDRPLKSRRAGEQREIESNTLLNIPALQEYIAALQNGDQALAINTRVETFQHLAQLQITLTQTQRQLEEIIQTVQAALGSPN